MFLFFFIVSFLASLAGAICGIGGGVIMKPLLDATGVMSVSAINFLSGCTVLTMSAVSIGTSTYRHDLHVRMPQILFMSIGAAIGGAAGKILFEELKEAVGNENKVGGIQAVVLLIITVLTLLYTLKGQKIRTLQMKSTAISMFAGILLGIFSAFLGIGGGPINLMVLNFLFSMTTKEAAVNSLFMILVSQIFSLMQTISTGTVPDIKVEYLLLMVIGGIFGGRLGNRIHKLITERNVQRLFIGLMLIIIGINLYNIYKFSINT